MLIPHMLRVYTSFGSFLDALDKFDTYFPMMSVHDYKNIKEQLIHYVLKYHSQKGLEEYQKYIHGKFEESKKNKDPKIKDFEILRDQAFHFHNYKEKVATMNKEQLQQDQRFLQKNQDTLQFI